MKKLIKVAILFLFISTGVAYAEDYGIDPEFMQDEEIDYGNFSSKSSNPESSVETQERSEYNIDINNYVTVSYVNTKTVTEKNK